MAPWTVGGVDAITPAWEVDVAMSAFDFLRDRLALSTPAGTAEDALSSVGISPSAASADTSPRLVAVFVTSTAEVTSVNLVSERMLGVYQRSSDGTLLKVAIPLERIRRVASVDDSFGMRVIIEIEADRSTAVTSVDEDGTSRSVQFPAGYELLAASSDERADLQSFATTLLRVL